METTDKLAAIRLRSAQRRDRIRSHRATGHADAERWDLMYWQDQGPEARLSALVAIHEDVHKVEMARRAI